MCCLDSQDLSVRPYLLRIFYIGRVWLHILTCFLQSEECPTSHKGIYCLSIFLVVRKYLKLEQRGMWHQGGQNFRGSWLSCTLVTVQLELQEQIPRNTGACTTPKANRATHEPLIGGSSNDDKAGWLWGQLAQVSTSKKAHVHLAMPAS